MSDKTALRAVTSARRRAAGWSAVETDVVTRTLEPLLGGVVASFLPLPDEPGLPPRDGWLLPVLLPSRALDWVRFSSRAPAGGTRAHAEDPSSAARLGPAALASADVVLVPAQLVSRSGVRLGRGGGSYDRALVHARGLTVALVRDEELVDVVPADPWDLPVAAVCTPSLGVVRLG